MHHPHLARVVELRVADKRVGSGYLLTDRLILTAYHVIAPDGTVRVRPVDALSCPPLTASRLWPAEPVDDHAHPEQDVALLLLDEPAGAPWPTHPLPGGAARFGEVTGGDRAPCHALGFPDAERRPDGDRDVMRLPGHVEPAQGSRFGMLTFYAGLQLRGERRWGGMSGGPLFGDDGLLLGTLVEDRNIALNSTMLRAVSVRTMLRLPGFRDVLHAHDVVPRISHELLELYLEAAVKEADDQPYAGVIGGRRPRLHEVHLRQQVRCLKDDEKGAEGHSGKRPPLVSSSLLLPADDVLTAGPACVVLAGPGGGKSSLLRTWLTEAAARRTAGDGTDPVPVPVLVPARALVGGDGKLAGGTFPAALAHAVGGEVWLELGRLFAGPPPGGGVWLVLVDGLDEILSARTRIQLLRHLTLLAGRNGAVPYRFVVATRPLPDGELDRLGTHIPRFDLLPFGREELPEVAYDWFTALGVADPRGSAARFIAEIQARDPLPELARTPLMAGLLCQLYARNPTGPLPAGRGEIYDEFVEQLRQHQAADDAAANVWEAALDLAGYIASERLARNDEPEEYDQSLDTLLESWPGQPPRGMTLRETVLRSGLLTDRAGELGFLQQTFLEYCAARYETKAPDECAKQVQQLFRKGWIRQRPARQAHPHWWGRRRWEPPAENRMSYAGFILDRLLNERINPAAEEVSKEMHRLTRRRTLAGCCFLAGQKRLGTALPDGVVQEVTASLRNIARITDGDRRKAYLRANPGEIVCPPGLDPTLGELHLATAQRDARVNAAEALHWLGDGEAADILAEIAETPYLTSSLWRAYAAAVLCELDDDRGVQLLHGLAADGWNLNKTRIEAAEALVHFGDERGVHQLDGYARDTRGFLPHERADALKALALLGHERSADVLHDFARDPDATPSLRNWSAQMLACIGDDRGAALLDAFAHDPAHGSRLRLIAATVLARVDQGRGAAVLAGLAEDRTLKRRHRRKAGAPPG